MNTGKFKKLIFFQKRPKVEQIKNKLAHANKLFNAAKNLPVSFLKQNKYDIWQKTHEPFNVKTIKKINSHKNIVDRKYFKEQR